MDVERSFVNILMHSAKKNKKEKNKRDIKRDLIAWFYHSCEKPSLLLFFTRSKTSTGNGFSNFLGFFFNERVLSTQKVPLNCRVHQPDHTK